MVIKLIGICTKACESDIIFDEDVSIHQDTRRFFCFDRRPRKVRCNLLKLKKIINNTVNFKEKNHGHAIFEKQ